jgi:cell division septum initiation protein DivIVA
MDHDVIILSGEGFLARMKALKDATAEHDAAFENLKLGTIAAEALGDAQRREQAVLDMKPAAEAAAAKIINDASEQAAGIIAAAQAEADKITLQAKVLAREVDEGREALTAWSEKTKADAARLMVDAEAARDAGERHRADNLQAARDLAAAQAEAVAARDAASAKEATLSRKLAAIRAVAAKAGTA